MKCNCEMCQISRGMTIVRTYLEEHNPEMAKLFRLHLNNLWNMMEDGSIQVYELSERLKRDTTKN